MRRTYRLLLGAAALATAAAMVACTGGFYIGIGPVDGPPNVSLAAAPALAAPGETISLVAAASDDYLVVEVRFLRIDAGGNTLLGRDSSAPYALDTVLPAGTAGQVRYFAQALDDAGQVGESQEVAVTMR